MPRRAFTSVAIVSVVLATCVMACDPGEAAQPRPLEVAVAPPRDFVSGARLRARYYVVDGLVDVFTTFHDVELGADCAYEDPNGSSHVGPNASSYCLPAGMAGHRQDRGPYLDSFCKVRGAFTPSTGAATYALVEPRNACVTAPEVHLTGPPRMRVVFLKDDSGECVLANEVSAQAFAGRVPLSAFVRAEEKFERRAGRLGARMLVGDDGSQRVVGGYDWDRKEASRVGLSPDGSRRWLPARAAFVGGGELLFSDLACGMPVAVKIARTATCPLQAAVVLEGTCGSGNYFELGAPMTSLFTRGDDKKCQVASAVDLLAFELGAPIPFSAYAPVVAVDIGSPVARRRGVGGAGDSPVSWGEVVAGATNEPCEVVATADGTLRCLPAAVAVVSHFSDAACTSPAFARTITGCEGGVDVRFVTGIGESPRVFEITAEVPALYTVEAEQCVPFTPVVASRGFSVREIEVTRFPLAVLAGD